MIALLWTLLALGLGTLAPGGLRPEPSVQEEAVDSRTVRDYRERLASGQQKERSAVLKAMRARPHSKWVELLGEALLRAVRTVQQAQERLPEAEQRVTELRVELQEARRSTSPSRVRRLEEQLAGAQAEFDEIQGALIVQLRAQDTLRASIEKVAKGLGPDGVQQMGEDFARRLRRLRDPLDRVTWLRVMGVAPSPRTTLSLMRVVRDPLESPDALVAALNALVNLRDPASLPAAVSALEHADWRVQAEAVELMRVLHRRTSIPFLIERLQSMQGRIRDDIGRALNSLTGQSFASDGRFWADWWEKNRDRLEMPDAPQVRVVDLEEDGGGVRFYGIATESRRVLFVLDVSGSMNEPARTYGNSSGTKSRKIDVARRNLRGALMALPEEAVFNVLMYSDRIEAVFEEVEPATHENKTEAVARVMAREPQGGTNIYAALVEGFEQSRPERRSRKDASPRVDTIYFLTDGQPTVGTVKQPALILKEAESRNELQRIRIHTVGVGAHDKGFMKSLAEAHGGTYIAQ